MGRKEEDRALRMERYKIAYKLANGISPHISYSNKRYRMNIRSFTALELDRATDNLLRRYVGKLEGN